MVTTPGFLPGEFHGQRSLAGYSPRGHKKSDTTNTQGVWCSDILSTELSGLENISDKLAIIVIFKKSSPSLLDTRKIRSRAINHIIERRPMKTSFVTRTLLTGDISVFTYITNRRLLAIVSAKILQSEMWWYLLYIFSCSYVGCIFVYNCYILLDWFLGHYIMSFFVSCYSLFENLFCLVYILLP